MHWNQLAGRLGPQGSVAIRQRRPAFTRPGRHGLLLTARLLVEHDGLTRRQVADTPAMKSGVAASLLARWATVLKEGDRQAATVIAAIEEDLDGQMSA